MVEHNRSEYAPQIDEQLMLVVINCKKWGLSEQEARELVARRVSDLYNGLSQPRKEMQLTNELKKFIERKETEITEKLTERQSGIAWDCYAVRYIVLTALCNSCCYKNNKKIKKKDVCDFLGYPERTMRNRKQLFEKDLLNPKSNTLEREIYKELCLDLQNYEA